MSPNSPDEKSPSAFLRQWKLLNLIGTSPEGVTIKEMAKKFDVSEKTIRRDLKILQSIPFTFDSSGGLHDEKRIFLNSLSMNFPLGLNFDELLSLYVGRHLMEPLSGTNFWESLQSGFEKIKRVLKPKVVEYAERVSPLFYHLERKSSDYSSHRDEIETLLVAMEDNREVLITYQSLHSEQAKTYIIQPYSFVYYHGFIYMVGYSRKDSEIRFWKINRLKRAKMTGEKFVRPPLFNTEEYMARALCPFVSEEGRVQVKVKFKKTIAAYVQELAWDSFKKIRVQKDGSLVVHLEMEGGKPFFHWLLSFGADVEVLSPKTIRDEYRQMLHEIIAKYETES